MSERQDSQCEDCDRDCDFTKLFKAQMSNQEEMIRKGMYKFFLPQTLPVDNQEAASYHLLQLTSEVGEVLSADKRWKNFRNKEYDKFLKAEEIADCFIVLMNIAMFSDLSSSELYNTISSKIQKVSKRIEEEEKESKHDC